MPGCKRSTPTYHEQVRPILEASCVECHRRGGLAPVPRLDSFEDAAAQAGKIKRAVQSRDMPPWGVDNSGACGTFQGAAWLDARDIAALSAWADGGHPAGDPRAAVAGKPPPPPRFGPAGATLDTGAPYTPGLGETGYRCFVSDPALARDALLTALRVTSTEPRSVAQITLFSLDDAPAEAEAARLDEADPGSGYTCYGSPRTSSFRMLASWTWGASVLRLPAAVRLRAGRKLVVQVHYDVIATGLDAPTRTRVELEFDAAAAEARLLPVAATPLLLAPGKNHVEASGRLTVKEPLRLVGVAPRMHTLGKVLELRRRHGSEDRCLASFDHWHFYRQQTFTWTDPVDLEPGDELAVSCVYTTLSRSSPVREGEGIEDEECVAQLYALPRG